MVLSLWFGAAEICVATVSDLLWIIVPRASLSVNPSYPSKNLCSRCSFLLLIIMLLLLLLLGGRSVSRGANRVRGVSLGAVRKNSASGCNVVTYRLPHRKTAARKNN
jgi:hypothetical protein